MTVGTYSRMRPSVAGALALWLLLGPGLAVAASSNGNGAIRGVLYQADESTKLAGARLTAVNVRSGKVFASNITGENGVYEVPGLPEGTYDLAIEVSGDVFVTDNLVDLARDQRLALSYSVQPKRPANRKVAGLAEPKGSATLIGSGPGGGAPRARSFWARPEGIGLLAVLGIGAAVAASNSGGNDNNASPSSP